MSFPTVSLSGSVSVSGPGALKSEGEGHGDQDEWQAMGAWRTRFFRGGRS